MTKIVLFIKSSFIKLTKSPKFIIKIEDGTAKKISGSVKNSFLIDCNEIVKRNDLKNGLIYSSQSSFGTIILKATNEIESDVLQQLRNAWSFNQ